MNEARGPLKRWLLTAAAVLLLFAVSAAALAGSLWLISELVNDKEARLVVAFVFGLAFLLTVISGIVAALHALELTSPKSAFGLPAGSIRAIIAARPHPHFRHDGRLPRRGGVP